MQLLPVLLSPIPLALSMSQRNPLEYSLPNYDKEEKRFIPLAAFVLFVRDSISDCCSDRVLSSVAVHFPAPRSPMSSKVKKIPQLPQ